MWQNLAIISVMSLTIISSKSYASAWLAIAFTSTVIFASSDLYEILPSVYIHVLYAVIISVFIPLATPNFWVALGMGIYAIFNLIVALDYLFYPKIDTILSIYYVHLHVLVDTILIYLSSKRVGNNGNGDAVVNHFIVCVGRISGSINRLQRLEKAQ